MIEHKKNVIKFELEEREARIIFAALNCYSIEKALSMMKEEIPLNITKKRYLQELDKLIEDLYYNINDFKK